jgi:tetratricopeptide (TPR) repeat protein
MKREGRSSEVIRECLKALSVYPDDIRLRSLLAESYLDVGFIGQAEAELNRISSEIASLVTAYKLQAYIYIRQQRIEEAHEALRRYLAHNPDDPEALDLLDRIKHTKEETVIEPVEEEQPLEYQETPVAVAQPVEEEREEMSELATPTLAEIYYNQGQIQEAIHTYEKVLLDDPNDEASKTRLSELRALVAEQTETPVAGKDSIKTRKEEMIGVLEEWLARIKESSHV